MRLGPFPPQVSILALSMFLLLPWALLPADVRAQLYHWTDEQGQVHVTDNPNDVPRYRSQALADPARAMRGAAVRALGSIGPQAKDALRPLRELDQREPGQRETAESIRKIEGR